MNRFVCGCLVAASLLLLSVIATADVSVGELLFAGGTRGEGAYRSSIAVASDGSVYIAGVTSSRDLPTHETAFQPELGGSTDLFVARLRPSSGEVVACTYLGGSRAEGEFAGVEMALNASGRVVVAGVTQSDGLPTTEGAFASERAGQKDVYVAVLSANLDQMLAGTYLGGSRGESYIVMSVERSGIFLAGSTLSDDFAAQFGEDLQGGSRSGDVFVCSLSPNLTQMTPLSLVGGGGDEYAEALVLSSNGSKAFVGGWTTSSDWATTSGAAQDAYGGGDYDGFIFSLSASSGALESMTYIGGNQWDFVYGMDWASDGLFVSGHTMSSNFPATPGAFDTAGGPTDDAFVAKLSLSLSDIQACTYLGGSGRENAIRVVAQSDHIFVTGVTASADFPIAGSIPDATYAGSDNEYAGDGFAVALERNLGGLEWSTLLGGSGVDVPGGVVAVRDGYWLSLSTSSNDFPGAGERPGGTYTTGFATWGGDLLALHLVLGD